MYMRDLSTYRFHGCDGLPNVLPVGWLSREQPFHKGTVTGTVLRKLTELAVFKSIHFMRGFHPCECCSTREIAAVSGGAAKLLGSAEIWIPGKHGLYASPNLIVHYIQAHGYQPPSEYLEAVEMLDVDEWIPPRDYVAKHRKLGSQ